MCTNIIVAIWFGHLIVLEVCEARLFPLLSVLLAYSPCLTLLHVSQRLEQASGPNELMHQFPCQIVGFLIV